MKKLLIIIGFGILFVAAILILLPFAFKAKLVQIAKDEINKNVNARVNFADASLSLFKSFPDFRLDLEGLQIIGKDKFALDTLVAIDALSLDIDLMSVFRGAPYEIKKIVLNKPHIKLITLADGSVNYDIAMPESAETNLVAEDASEPFTISMKSILIRNGKLVYDDQSLNFSMLVDEVEGSVSGDFSADLAELQLELNSNSLNMTYEAFDYLSNVKTKFSSLLIADMKTSTYTLKKTEAILNQLVVGFEGSFVLGEVDYLMDFSFKSKDSNFKNLLSLMPVLYARQFEKLKTEGAFDLNGSVIGIYNDTSMPGFAIDLKVENASVRYPDLPKSIENIYVSLNIDNESGIVDETTIDLSRFQMRIAGNPLSATLKLKTPVSNPDFDAGIKGKIDLNSLADVIPLEKEESLKGNMDFDLSVKAKMSDIDQKRYNQIAAKGSFVAQGLEFNSSLYTLPIKVKEMKMTLDPATVELPILNVQLGKSDFDVNGKISDFLPYYLSDGVLKGMLHLNSELIDATELLAAMPADTNAKIQSDSSKISLHLPERIEFIFLAKAEKLLYENYELNQVNANIHFQDQTVRLNPLIANLIGGSMQMEGFFDGGKQEVHPFDFDFKIKDFDIFESYKTIGLFQKAVPIAEKTKGKFSTAFRLKGQMDNETNLIYKSLVGGGVLQTSQISIENVKTMEQLAKLLGNDKYSRFITDGLNFSFEIINGKVYQKPFKINYADSDVSIGGNIGFDQSLDYDFILQVPYEKLGSVVQLGISKLIAVGANAGVPVSLGTSIKVNAKITGTVTDPKISIDYKDFLGSGKGDLATKVNQELERQKEELKEKAKGEAEKMIAEAKKQGDALIAEAEMAAQKMHEEAVKAAELAKAEANKQADRLVEEASKNGMVAALAANEVTKKVRLEGEKTANKLIQEADNKANNLIEQAKQKADELLLKARDNAEKI